MMAEALEAAGLLDQLVTRWVFMADELEWARRLALPAGWQRRTVAPVTRRRLHRLPIADVAHRISRARWGFESRAIDASFSWVDRKAARLIHEKTSAVIGREDGCLRAFQCAQTRGVPTIYQLPTAYCATVRELVEREMEEFPEAFDRCEMLADFAPERLARKRQELDSAQYVLCPSAFVERSVVAAGVPAARTATMPLGVDSRWTAAQDVAREKVFLYVGNISARKGVHRLIRVWKKLGAHRTHTLRLIGDLNLPPSLIAEYRGIFEHVPRMPREQLIVYYSSAEAFVFNAMADGFGHVFAEAMVCGTPVLCSRNCGAPDLVTDGVEGRLFEYGDDDQLATVLEWALGHPKELAEMGPLARQRALAWGWNDFGSAFLNWLRSITRMKPGK